MPERFCDKVKPGDRLAIMYMKERGEEFSGEVWEVDGVTPSGWVVCTNHGLLVGDMNEDFGVVVLGSAGHGSRVQIGRKAEDCEGEIAVYEERGASRRRWAERITEGETMGYNKALRQMLRPYRNVYAIDYSIERLGYDIDVVVHYRQTHVGCPPSGFDPGEADEFDIIAVEIPGDGVFEFMRGLVFKFDEMPTSEQDEIEDWIYENHRP